MERAACPTDLTDAPWEAIQTMLPKPKGDKSGRLPKYPRRDIWNALLY